MPHFLRFLAFLLMISRFKMASKHSEVLSSVSKLKKAGLCVRRKYTLDELCWGMSYNAVGCEFNINKTTMYIK